MGRYRPYAAAYAALHRRQRATAAGPPLIPARVVRDLVAARCAAGEHQPETDEVTGDEVCRHCGTVTDDYSDVVNVVADPPDLEEP